MYKYRSWETRRRSPARSGNVSSAPTRGGRGRPGNTRPGQRNSCKGCAFTPSLSRVLEHILAVLSGVPEPSRGGLEDAGVLILNRSRREPHFTFNWPQNLAKASLRDARAPALPAGLGGRLLAGAQGWGCLWQDGGCSQQRAPMCGC